MKQENNRQKRESKVWQEGYVVRKATKYGNERAKQDKTHRPNLNYSKIKNDLNKSNFSYKILLLTINVTISS